MLLTTAASHAQEAAATAEDSDQNAHSLAEVIVTASRQEQSITRVPISITAFTQQELDERGIQSIDDIARVTPGIRFQRSDFSSHSSQISIRGIEGTSGASTTGIYIDDTPIHTRDAALTSTNVFPAVFDLARIEVLRGPQGTLFGSGSEGGTVRFITPDPGLEKHEGYMNVEMSSTEDGDPSYEAGGALGGPIVEGQLGFRLSALYRHEGGWVDRVDRLSGEMIDDRQNSGDTVVLRGAVTWAPTESLRITPSVYYQDLDYDGNSRYWQMLSNPGEGSQLSGNALKSPASDEFVLPALKLEYDFGAAQLVSNTSYLERDTLANPDFTQFVRAVTTRSPFPLLPGEFSRGYFIDEQKGFTQEIRLQSHSPGSRLHWVAGIFYNETRQLDIEIVESPLFPQIVLNAFGVDYRTLFGTPLGAMNSVFTDRTRTVDEQIAAFGQLDYGVTAKLKATAGVRYAKVDFSFRSENEGPFAGNAIISGEQSERPVTPKFGLSYQANDDNLFYVSAARGFRPGGAQRIPPVSCAANLAALGITTPPATFDADSVWSYEVGAKNRLLGDRLQVSTSVYWIDWTDIQQVVPLRSCGQSFISNLGKATSKGFDLALDALIADSLTLGVAVGYTNAEYSDTLRSGPALVALEGEPISQVSPWLVSLTGQYDFLLAGKEAFLRFGYDYGSAGPRPNRTVFGSDPNGFFRDETHMLSVRAGMQIDNASVSLFVDNLSDSHPELTHGCEANTSPLCYSSTFRPRTVGLTLSYKY